MEKGRVELDVGVIKRKALLDSREISTKGRSELESGNKTDRQYRGEGAMELSANNQVVNATDMTTRNNYEAAPTVHDPGALSQPVVQSPGVVDDELLWLEQEEARMKESQARFQVRKEQLLAQKAGEGGGGRNHCLLRSDLSNDVCLRVAIAVCLSLDVYARKTGRF